MRERERERGSGREFARVVVAQHSCDKDDDVGGSSSSSTTSSSCSSSSSIGGGGGGDGGGGGGGGGSGGDGGEGAASSMVVVLPVVEEAWVGSSVRAAAPCRTRTIHPDADGVATLSQPPPKTCSRKLQERSSRRLRTIVRFTWPEPVLAYDSRVTRCYPADSFSSLFERAAWKRVE